jgi:hypothetical protein
VRHLTLAGLAIVALLFVVVGLAAFESHVVNVRAHVVDPLSQEILDCEAEGPDGLETCPDFLAVPVGVPVTWTFQIHVSNPLDVALTGVEVTEDFGSQVALSVKGPHAGSAATSYPSSPQHPHLRWYDLTLLPGDSYTLKFEVTTLDGEFAEPVADLILATGAVMIGSNPTHGAFTATTAAAHIEVFELPDGLEINTDIDFGIVFPQQIRTDHFKVCLSKTWCGCCSQTKMDYKIVLELKPLECGGWGCHQTEYYPDLRPYLLVERDPAETGEPAEPDGTAGGLASPDDYIARGHLDARAGDKCDTWLVTMKVPIYRGDYNPETDPISPEEVLVVDVDLEGVDLGADIQVKLDGWWWWWLWDWWGGH